MRLTELEPRWLMFEGRRVGFIFRCPLPAKRDNWQTCFVEQFRMFSSRSGEYLKGADGEWLGSAPDSQCGIITACCPDINPPGSACRWQGCKPDFQWTVAGGIEAATWDTLTVTPSLDGSAAGNWHGFITNGEIVGGL
jgi:hypothetical protein